GQCEIENNNLVERYGIENYELDQHSEGRCVVENNNFVEQYEIENYDLGLHNGEQCIIENNNFIVERYEIENYDLGQHSREQYIIENNNLVERYGIKNYDLDQHSGEQCVVETNNFVVVERYGIENYDLVEGRYEIENNNLVIVEGQYEIANENLNQYIEEEQHEVETKEGENIAIGPIFGSELEGLDPMKYLLITSFIELSAGKYKPNKTKSISQQCNKGSKRTDCKWHVNLISPGYTNYMHIAFAYLQHNHEINADNNRFTTAFRCFDESIMAEIEHAVKIKRNKKVAGSNASHLLKFLINQQKEESTMFVQLLINIDSKSCLGAQAFLNNETQESYKWVLQQTLDATGSEPRVFITDMDPAMDTACKISTQRVESLNALIHKKVSSSLSMTDAIRVIDSRMQKEALNMSFVTWKYKSLIYHQPFIIERLFSNIEELIQKHLSSRIIEELKNQMCESILYQCKKLEVDSATKFNKDQLEEHNGESDESQMALINSVPKDTIKEVWRIIPYMAPNSYQHIILLNDNTYL
ncbi:35468_t:CDS:10, partial [Gigaspora margarita]